MEDSAFSDAFCEFVQSTVPSVEATELLLVVARMPAAWWSAEEAFARVGLGTSLSAADGHRHLERFCLARLVVTGPDKKMRYQPATDELAAHVRTLRQAYEERPVTLIRLIYALRDTTIRSFADAFSLRK
jgi:hypothetical protein